MKKFYLLGLALLFGCTSTKSQVAPKPTTPAPAPAVEATSPAMPASPVPLPASMQNLSVKYKAVAERIIAAALKDSSAWNRLAEMCDKFGPRFSGSKNLEDAIDWILAEMKKDGLQKAMTEDVMVPNWKRGKETLTMVSPREMNMPLLALGGSVETGAAGITAEVVIVNSFAEMQAKRDQIRGKILLFNAPFVSYGETVIYRTRGAIEAAKMGAVASIIRAVGPYGMITPHTGGMSYDEVVPKIPGVAIAMEHADMLARMQKRGDKIVLKLVLDGHHFEPDAKSRNVMAEVTGKEFPEQVVVMGGHIDSWDVGSGAMDDGGGSVVSWMAVKLLKDLGLTPRRTVRATLWTNEENGLRGGQQYRDNLGDKVKDHILAIESDGGVFKPTGFGFTGSEAARAIVTDIARLLEPIESGQIGRSGGGADIGPIMRDGVPGMGLNVDGSKYFWFHHTQADTPDKLNPREMALCVATMAVMAYIVADLPERLPR
jgi:carboxypeptidase Q